jgi:uncharacterized protein YbjT (DUF2867 family)
MTILVTGANGTTGGATLQALVDRGARVRALVRDASKLDPPDGVELAVGDFDDESSLLAALDGVDRAFLVGASSPRQVDQEAAFIAAASRVGLEQIVALSVIGADAPGVEALRFGAAHVGVEASLRDSGLPTTLLRPNSFFQNLLGQAPSIAGSGAFYSPLSPAARVSAVDAVDIGEVAAVALTEDGHIGQAYTLTGPEALNDDEVAARLGAALGIEVTHVQVPVEAARESFLAAGYPEWNADGLLELFALYETGAVAEVSGDVERVLGRPARSIDDFARAHAAAFGAA